MPVSTRWKVDFNSDTGLFEITIFGTSIPNTHITLPPAEYLGLVKYLGEIALSYTDWLKQGGNLV